MSEQELKAFKLYGKVPAKNLLTKMQKVRASGQDMFVSLRPTPTHIAPHRVLTMECRTESTLTLETT